jgi:hypothetical protein
MAFSFERPIGAAADVNELEYITAIHQTTDDDNETFIDGSIDANDVKVFLRSRYGIVATEDEVKELIFSDLGGGNDGCIDLVEVVSLLVIPYLAKIAFLDENNLEDNRNAEMSRFEKEAFRSFRRLRKESDVTIIGDVLNIIMTDATGSDEPQPLTKELVRKIFKAYNEEDLVDDDALLDEMIDMASGRSNTIDTDEAFLDAAISGATSDADGIINAKEDASANQSSEIVPEGTPEGEPNYVAVSDIDDKALVDDNMDIASGGTTGAVLLDTAAFSRGLTSDITLYNPLNETKFTTHYEDVFGSATLKDRSMVERDYDEVDDAERGEASDEGTHEVREVRRVLSLAQIDSIADTFRDKTHYILAVSTNLDYAVAVVAFFLFCYGSMSQNDK